MSEYDKKYAESDSSDISKGYGGLANPFSISETDSSKKLPKEYTGKITEFVRQKIQYLKGKEQKTNPIIIIAAILILYGIIKKG